MTWRVPVARAVDALTRGFAALPRPAAIVLRWLPPVLFSLAWMRWAMRVVRQQELEIRPLGALAYATFVQLADAWSEGNGWVQTVHRGYAQDWRWGGHYAPVLFVSSWIAGLGESPWALARVQAGAVSLGILGAWALGRAEAGWAGAVAAATMYACSGTVMVMALADYQDLVFTVPLLPAAVWAARHATPTVFVLLSAMLGACREEALVLLPLVGLAGGLRRALMGGGVAAVMLALWLSLGPSPYPNPLTDIVRAHLFGPAQPPPGAPPPGGAGAGLRLEPDLWRQFASTGFPWLFAAPVVALPAVPVAIFHAADPTGTTGIDSPAVHHLAPFVGATLAAGMVGACTLVRAAGRGGWAVTAAVVGLSVAQLAAWQGPLHAHAVRTRGAPPHPAWELLAQIPDGAAVLVSESIAPAGARRLRVVTADSIGDHVPVAAVRWAVVDDPSLAGTEVAVRSGWRLLRDPAPRARAAQPAVGTVNARQ